MNELLAEIHLLFGGDDIVVDDYVVDGFRPIVDG